MNLSKWHIVRQLFIPAADSISLKEKLQSGIAAIGGIALVLWISSQFLDAAALPWVVASMGASAVLLFAVPLGPLSQPWPFIGGHLISGFIGITVVQLLPDSVILASALAVGIAISVMYITRCLHPPGGATALTVVMGGPAVRDLGYQYLLTPVALNLIAMLVWALIINNLLANRCYPNSLPVIRRERQAPAAGSAPEEPAGISDEDLRYALAGLDEYVDVSPEHLRRIAEISAAHASRRRIGELSCEQILSAPAISAGYDTEVEALWRLMGQHKIRSIPIIDDKLHPIGIVTIADFLNQVKVDNGSSLQQRMQNFIKRTDGLSADKPEYAGHIMSTGVTCARTDQSVLELLPVFYQQGRHHLPVINTEGQLVGMLTPRNLLAALHNELQRASTNG